MKKIFKYDLAILDVQTIEVPQGSIALCVQDQPRAVEPGLKLWAEIFEEPLRQPYITCQVYIVGTGHPMPKEAIAANYLGSVQQSRFIWHVYTTMTTRQLHEQHR